MPKTTNNETHVNPDTAHAAIGESLLSDALTRARGRHQPYCLSEPPRHEYYVSNLAPTYGKEDRKTYVSQILPSSITLEFRPATPDTPLEDVEFEFDVYIPSLPTYAEYIDIRNDSIRSAALNFLRNPATGDDGPEDADSDEDLALDEPTVSVPDGAQTVAEALNSVEGVEPDDLEDDIYALNERFLRRVTVQTAVTIDPTDAQVASQEVTENIQAAITDAIDTATENDDIVVTPNDYRPTAAFFDDIDFSNLSEDDHQAIIDNAPTVESDADSLYWNVGAEVEVRNNSDEYEVALRLVNRPIPNSDDDEIETPTEPHIINPRISVETELNQYRLDLLPEDYRFNQNIWAKAQNCSTTHSPLDDGGESYRRIETTATPTSPVYEFEFRTEYRDREFDLRFAALAGDVTGVDSLDALRDIERGMRDYLSDWQNERRDAFIDEYGESEELAEFDEAADAFDAEREEFRDAIKLLEERPEVREAFELMNRVNHRLHMEMTDDGEGFERWRLFQLVFIVKNLPSIVTRDPNPDYEKYADTQRDERAEVLWFPTGGGKTEAYLGLVVFNLFFDRMRGKRRGITAWIRFPLRLLSRQQKQRFMEAMLVAEQYRAKPKADGGLGNKGERFTLGYFPGSQDSPNEIGTDLKPIFERSNEPGEEAAQETLEDECKHLDECPLCDSSIRVEYQERENTVHHYCTGDELNDGEECLDKHLPFYVVDHDIYRYTPSVLLGSLDKIAVMGLNPRFANIFGNFTTECPIHGLGYSENCPEKSICEYSKGSDEFKEVEPGTRDPARRESAKYFDPIPTLHLVDEVHLLNEDLGTMASHYESTFLTLCKRVSETRDDDGNIIREGVTPKVLTSTATIEEYERQIEMLFQMEASRFPEEGPALMETFYGELDEAKVEREYRGMTPNSRAHLYAVLDFIKQYHELIRDYYDADPDDLLQHVVRGFHQRNPRVRQGLDPTDDDDLDTLIGEALDTWDRGFDADVQANVLDKYETSLLYFTNIQEKDTYRQNLSQVNNEMEYDGYNTGLLDAQLTGDTRDDDILPRLEREGKFDDEPFEDRYDTVPATSFVGHGIDVDRFNFMLFYGYPSQTFQYIQASSRVGRQSGIPGFVIDVFRPFDKRDRHRYKYFEKLHQYLNRTVEPVAIDRWAKFAVEKTFSGVMMSLFLQYYRPLLFREGKPPGIEGSAYDRVNIQSAGHMAKVMDNPDYPQLSKDLMRESLRQAYALGDKPYYLSYVPQRDGKDFQSSDAFVETISDRLTTIWNDWRESLSSRDMASPSFPPADAPMRSLRHIEPSVGITAFPDQSPILKALDGN